jgi:hypothetical protein
MTVAARIACALPLLILLAGCAGRGPTPDTPQAQCARQVEQDPDVRTAEDQVLTLTATQGQASHRALDNMKQKKLTACLQLRGISLPGGVEKVQR